MVAAYAVLARGGIWRTPRLRRDAEPAAGETKDGVRVVDERTAFWVADVLSDDPARAYVFGRGGSLAFPFPVAAKTGTSQAYHDNWTIGFTRDVTVGVWVGNFDRTPLRNSSGVTGAAPIFHDVMLAAQRRVGGGLPAAAGTVVRRPDDLVPRPVCALSGRAATALCPRVQTEWLPSGERAECTWHVGRGGRVAVAWPPVYRSWARDRGLLDSRTARPLASAETPQLRPAAVATPRRAASASLRILNPPAGAVYLRDPTLRDAFQTLPLRAESGRSDRLTWEVNGRVVGTAPADGAVEWPLARGPHVITVSDAAGRKAETTIEVR
jgi:penicillin-binding protein 1C